MIEAKPQVWAQMLFRPYVFWLMKRHFSSITLLGDRPYLPPDYPMLLLPNHSSWWDGFLVYLVNQRIFRRPLYIMMLQEQLKQYHFFQYLGAYSIAPGRPKEVSQTINYTMKLLQEKNPIVCIFPQGELLPWYQRPLRHKRIVEWLLERFQKPVSVLSLVMRLEFRGEQKAEGFFQFGPIHHLTAEKTLKTAAMEQEMIDIMDNLEKSIFGKPVGEILLKGFKGIAGR